MLVPFSILPSSVRLFTEGNQCHQIPVRDGDISAENALIQLLPQENGNLKINVTGDIGLRTLQLHWNLSTEWPQNTHFLGDCWERSYGNMRWDTLDPNRDMPWFFMASCGNRHFGLGVKTNGGAFANFMVNENSIALFLDLRCGCAPSYPNGRMIQAAELTCITPDCECTAYEALRLLTAKIASNPPKPLKKQVYGFNNWYYAYGKSSQQEILSDTDYLMDLCKGNDTPPYMVIDDGWQKFSAAGPWNCGNANFPDMQALAENIARRGAVPGLWFRPLRTTNTNDLANFGFGERKIFGDGLQKNTLDPSHNEVLDKIRQDIMRFGQWGYKLVKHDFTTLDTIAEYGYYMYRFPGIHPNSWHFHDQTKTSAEILSALYQTISKAADDAGIITIGCNVMPHLAAGHDHLIRTGNDTSGRFWEETRNNGINALAFRMPAHDILFCSDADCVGITDSNVPTWEQNAQWAKLLAKSGTPFFASIKPGVLSKTQNEFMRDLFRIASKKHQPAVPIDWMTTKTPRTWQFDDGTSESFNWAENGTPLPDFLRR